MTCPPFAPLNCLLLLVAVRQAYGFVDPSHLCHKVTSGSFGDIQLHSFTYYGPNRFWVFESDRRYVINRTTEMGPDALFLPVANYTSWNADELYWVTEQRYMAPSHPRFLYMLGFANPDRRFSRWKNLLAREGLWINLVDDTSEYLWDVWCNTKLYEPFFDEEHCMPHETWKTGRVRPDYAIVADQFADHPEGYVLHRDIYDNRNHFILYDLQIERRFMFKWHFYTVDLNIHRFDTTPLKRTKAAFYYLEKTNDPHTVRLVHRRNVNEPRPGTEADRQLLSPKQHPLGFKNGQHTFLFDSQLGCVYVLLDVPHSLATQYTKNQTDLLLRRISIPYEEFFKCNVEYYKPLDFHDRHAALRCQTTVSGPAKSTEPPLRRSFLPTVVLIALLILLFLVVLFLVVYFWLPGALKRRQQRLKEAKALKRLLSLKEAKEETKATEDTSKRGLPTKTEGATMTTTRTTGESSKNMVTLKKKEEGDIKRAKKLKPEWPSNTMSKVLAV